ncbi:MAG: YfcE family phosphodiesterase [Myxococcota bacterium]
MFRAHPVRVGVVSDVHAHLADLDRALELLVGLGADRIVCLGDALEKGDDPDAVVSRLHQWLVPCVAGNHDLNALAHRAVEPDSLRPETADLVAAWPLRREYTWGGVRVLLAHATPYDTQTAVLPHELPRELKRRLRTLDADVLLLGHAHRPFAVRWQDLVIANPGSVRGESTRDSHTAGLLHLPERRFDLVHLGTGEVERLL